MENSQAIEKLVIDLFNKNCIKFGKFTLKNGKMSPIYIDLKNIISFPYLVNTICGFFINKIKNIDCDYICGVPYGGIPIASIISNKVNIPMIMVRKELKKYGLKKSIEGEYESGKSCILIEDTITTGGSVNKFIQLLNSEGIEVKYVFVICDRRDNTVPPPLGYEIISLFNAVDIFKTLKKHNMISAKNDYLNKFIVSKYGIFSDFISKKKSLNSDDKVASALISVILKKQTNLCFSLGLQEEIDIKWLIQVLGKIGSHICILKINSENIRGFKNNIAYINALIKMSNELEFMIYDDTKITIGNNLNLPWCNFNSILGLQSLCDNKLLKNKIKLNKIKNIFDYKGFVLSIVNQANANELENVILFEGRELNLNLSIEKKIKSLFLSNTYNFDEDQSYESLSSYFETEIYNDMDIICVNKKKEDVENIEKCILLCKSLSWSVYKKKYNDIKF